MFLDELEQAVTVLPACQAGACARRGVLAMLAARSRLEGVPDSRGAKPSLRTAEHGQRGGLV
jgi:hypothetical protein